MNMHVYRFPGQLAGDGFTAWRLGDRLCVTYQHHGHTLGGVETFRLHRDELERPTPVILTEIFVHGDQAVRVA